MGIREATHALFRGDDIVIHGDLSPVQLTVVTVQLAIALWNALEMVTLVFFTLSGSGRCTFGAGVGHHRVRRVAYRQHLGARDVRPDRPVSLGHQLPGVGAYGHGAVLCAVLAAAPAPCAAADPQARPHYDHL